MGLGNLDINDCNDDLEILIRSSIGGVGFLSSELILTENTYTALLGFTAYNPITDLLLVFKNGVYLGKSEYISSKDGGYIKPSDDTQWIASSENPIHFIFILLKAVPLKDVKFDGSLIQDGTIEYSKISTSFMEALIKDFENNYKISADIIEDNSIDIKKLSSSLQNYITSLGVHLLYTNSQHIPYAVATIDTMKSTPTTTIYNTSISPTPLAYYDGMALSVKIKGESTGTSGSAIIVDGLGIRSVKKANGYQVSFKDKGIYTIRYNTDTANFILQGEGGNGDATASDLRSGKKASVDAGDIVGNIPDLDEKTYEVSTTDQIIQSKQYIKGNQTIKGYPDLLPENVVLNKKIGTVTGKAVIMSTDSILLGIPYLNLGEDVYDVFAMDGENDFFYRDMSYNLKHYSFSTRTITSIGLNLNYDISYIGKLNNIHILSNGIYDSNFQMIYDLSTNNVSVDGYDETFTSLFLDPKTNRLFCKSKYLGKNKYGDRTDEIRMRTYSMDFNTHALSLVFDYKYYTTNNGIFDIFCVYDSRVYYVHHYANYECHSIYDIPDDFSNDPLIEDPYYNNGDRYYFYILPNQKRLLEYGHDGTGSTPYGYWIYDVKVDDVNLATSAPHNDVLVSHVKNKYSLGTIRCTYGSYDLMGDTDVFTVINGNTNFILTSIGEKFVGFTKNFIVCRSGNLYKFR